MGEAKQKERKKRSVCLVEHDAFFSPRWRRYRQEIYASHFAIKVNMGLSCSSNSPSKTNVRLKEQQATTKQLVTEKKQMTTIHNGVGKITRRALAHCPSHTNCRSTFYNTEIQRFLVPDDKVSWETNFPDYQPVEFTTEKVKKNPKADPIDP